MEDPDSLEMAFAIISNILWIVREIMAGILILFLIAVYYGHLFRLERERDRNLFVPELPATGQTQPANQNAGNIDQQNNNQLQQNNNNPADNRPQRRPRRLPTTKRVVETTRLEWEVETEVINGQITHHHHPVVTRQKTTLTNYNPAN